MRGKATGLLKKLSISLDAKGSEVIPEIREATVEGEALGGFPAGEFGNFVFHGKPQGQVQRSKADAGGQGLRVKLLAKKDVGERALPV